MSEKNNKRLKALYEELQTMGDVFQFLAQEVKIKFLEKEEEYTQNELNQD